MGSERVNVTITKFLQLLMILELYLELSYFLSHIYIQPADIGLPTGNGKILSCTQAQLGQVTGLAFA